MSSNTTTPTREEVRQALDLYTNKAFVILEVSPELQVLVAVAQEWLEITDGSVEIVETVEISEEIVVDEAMIERAADELRIIDDEWDSMSPMTIRGMAERVLRAALEVNR